MSAALAIRFDELARASNEDCFAGTEAAPAPSAPSRPRVYLVSSRAADGSLRRFDERVHSSPPGNYYPGGDFNRRFDELVRERGGYRAVTPSELNEIRDQVVKEFGL